jgi:hypothetical protein
MTRLFHHLVNLRVGVAVLALLTGGAGCYSPNIQNGTLACASGNRCPRGFVCRKGVGLCFRTQADAAASDASAGVDTDGAARDAAVDTKRDVAIRDVAIHDVAINEARPTAGDGGLGSSCNLGAQCASGICADGVCCQSACSGQCEACNLKDNVGVCTPVVAGVPSPTGHPVCPTDPTDSCARDGSCDGKGGCRLRLAGSSCGTSSCSGGAATPAPVCNGLGQCLPSTPRTCAPFACNGNTACFDSCTSNTQCQAPNSCAAGSCGPKSNGSSCSQSSECSSQHCVDSVCCDQACTETCKACDSGTSTGTCTQVTSGPPHGLRAPCTGNGACGGSCTSASATACMYPKGDVTCRAASCSGNTFTARAGCDGAGSCSTSATMSCGDLVCDTSGTACLAMCTSDHQCATAARPYCDGGACVSVRSNGARCQTAQECASQQCVDGYCCNDACLASCQACDVAGHVGTCSPVPSGTPYGGRASCGGAGSCAGYCNNLSSGQCFFPGSSTSCACPSGVGSGTCNAKGQCQLLVGLCL